MLTKLYSRWKQDISNTIDKIRKDFNSCNVARFVFWSIIGETVLTLCLIVYCAYVQSHAQVPPVNSGTFVWPTSGSMPAASLSATSSSIGGAILLVGGCTSGTVNVPGAVVGMTVLATPNTYPGDGAMWRAYVSSTDTVTIKICAVIALTPAASTYNVRVW